MSDHFSTRSYRVRHRTSYTYDDDVLYCAERGFLAPRETPTQRVLSNEITVSPEPTLISEHTDFFGNNSFYVEVREPHTRLEVDKISVVEVTWPQVDTGALDEWSVGSVATACEDPIEQATFSLPSDLVPVEPTVAAYADQILRPERPLGEALSDLCTSIHRDFSYRPGATTVRTTLAELMSARAGVCQDFTHVALACLRHAGIPARYVSGYLETQPPPGQEKLEGADASHAWVSAWTPLGWVDLDPTNDQFADSRYVVTAWGRDFRDVSPLKGVIFTEARSSSLDVGVDVTRLDEVPPVSVADN